MANVQIREQYKEIAVKIAVGLALCAVFFHFLITPVFSQSVALRQQLLETRERLELFKEVSRLKDELLVTEQPFAALTARSSLVGKISDIASKNKIDVQAITPKTVPEGEYVRLRIEVSGQASYFSMIKFLKEMETLEPPMSIGDISLSRQFGTGKKTRGILKAQLYLETYLLKQTRGRKSA
jgi:hypothetical protein